MPLRALSILIILCSALPTAFAELDVAVAIKPKTLWPDTIVLDWQTLNIDADQKRIAALGLTNSQNEIAKLFVKDSAVSRLDTLMPKSEDNTATLARALNKYLAGQRSGLPLLIQPLWASLQGHQIILIAVSDSRTNVVLNIVHHVITKDAWKSLIQAKSTAEVFSSTARKLCDQILANSSALEPRSPDLALGLHATTISGSSHELERNALNLLLAVQHLNSYTIVNPLSQEQIAMIHRAWSAQGLLSRSNRNLSIAWYYPENIVRQSLPLTLGLVIKPTDGVFAQPLTWQIRETASLDITNDNQLNITPTQSAITTLKDRLSDEKKSLARSDNPLASSIRGAWVYLDKGRAWGLKMNDRLVIATGTATIKGHVVGYFGPEMHLKSPRGFPIQEGAIMFVRKGQRGVKIGNEFSYDKMNVPTPWPPKAQ